MQPQTQYEIRNVYRKQLEQDRSPRVMVETIYNYIHKHHRGDKEALLYADGILAAHVENLNYEIAKNIDAVNEEMH